MPEFPALDFAADAVEGAAKTAKARAAASSRIMAGQLLSQRKNHPAVDKLPERRRRRSERRRFLSVAHRLVRPGGRSRPSGAPRSAFLPSPAHGEAIEITGAAGADQPRLTAALGRVRGVPGFGRRRFVEAGA